MKDTIIKFKIEQDRKKEFQKVCKENKVTMGQVLRYYLEFFIEGIKRKGEQQKTFEDVLQEEIKK